MDNRDALIKLINSETLFSFMLYERTINDSNIGDLDYILIGHWENILKLDLLPQILKKIGKVEEPDLFYLILGIISTRNIKWSSLNSTVDWIVNLFIEKSKAVTRTNNYPLILPNIAECITFVTLDLQQNLRIGARLIPPILDFLKRTRAPPEVKTYSNPTSPFALIKGDLIKIIGNTCYSCRENQDLIANLDGIGVILDHCNIQDDYPFIKECSIFALRNLTQGHAENQAIISQLEPIKLSESSQSLLREIARV